LNRLVAALYRKYRPQTFDDVVGQEPVVRTLRNAIANDQLRQAYLFAGPRGTGKTSMARILAKSVNCAQGPTTTPDNTCHACVAISNGTSLDVVEMDAASQRGIDDIREIRERVVLQPVEGRYKVYILDEAHQLTDAAWNALLKLIEEPPPHLLFVFCTTELQKVIPTVRSRCQTFPFARPRFEDLVKVLGRVAEGEGFQTPEAALSQIARASKGSFRDAVSMLDQLAAATGGELTVQSVLQLLGAVDEESLFQLCDLIIDHDTAGALTFVEQLSEQGQDIGRLVSDLLQHLRHLLLVQHLGAVPETIPATEEAREKLLAQANQLPEATVLRLCDLLAVAVEDMRQGGDPRLPLELALVKVTRPGADLSQESLAYRLELLEQRSARSGHGRGESSRANDSSRGDVAEAAGTAAGRTVPVTEVSRDEPESVPEPEPEPEAEDAPEPPSLAFEQLQEAWQRSVLPAVQERSIPAESVLREARPVALAGDELTIEFPAEAEFHRRLAEDPKNANVLREALYQVTGRKLDVLFVLGEKREHADPDEPASAASEEDLVALFKETFDAREVDE
jgi:DNA polymerase-3 subunit gamma/tau